MKVICNARKLADAFFLAASVAPTRSPKEILQNVKMTAEGDTIRLTATDCEVAIEVRVHGVETLASGSVLLPVSRTAAILRETTAETIEIETDEHKLLIRADRSKFHLMTVNADEFPTFASKTGTAYHELTARSLSALIRRTVFATDDDSSRYALGGVNLEADESRLIAVGTDGRRLATCDAVATAIGGHVMPDGKSIVPSRAAKLVERAIGTSQEEIVRVTASLNDVVFETSQCVIYSRIVDGRYPNWRQVFPKTEMPSTIRVLNGLFLSAVRQASIATSKDVQGIEISFRDGEIRMEASAPEVGESSVNMIADTDMAAQGITLKVDNRFVREFCGVLDPDALITITVQDSMSAMLLETDDGYRYVIMPMALER